jgi:hypothetical protein
VTRGHPIVSMGTVSQRQVAGVVIARLPSNACAPPRPTARAPGDQARKAALTAQARPVAGPPPARATKAAARSHCSLAPLVCPTSGTPTSLVVPRPRLGPRRSLRLCGAAPRLAGSTKASRMIALFWAASWRTSALPSCARAASASGGIARFPAAHRRTLWVIGRVGSRLPLLRARLLKSDPTVHDVRLVAKLVLNMRHR